MKKLHYKQISESKQIMEEKSERAGDFRPAADMEVSGSEIKKFDCAVEFVCWMNKEKVYDVLSEFHLWYKEEMKNMAIKAEHDEDVLDDLMDKWYEEMNDTCIGELPLPSLDDKFMFAGVEFKVRDALSLAGRPVMDVVEDTPNDPDDTPNWEHPAVKCTNGVCEFAYGFCNGIYAVKQCHLVQ